MAGTFALVVRGLDLGGSIQDLDPRVVQAAIRAINEAAAQGKKLAATAIYRQTAFPQGYLNADRLYVGRKANGDSLQTRIHARDRATSLARFTSGSIPAKGRQQGVTVTVKPGVAKFLPNAFLIALKSGNSDTLGNLGLAIRSKSQPDRAYKPTQLGPNLWLLYGPSVGEVFKGAGDSGRGVRDQISEAVSRVMNDEFERQLELLGVTHG